MNGMDPQDQRNFLIAMALMIAVIFGYQTFVVQPEQERREAAQRQIEEAEAERSLEAGPSTEQQAESEPAIAETVEEALSRSDRLSFDAPRVDGSIRLQGAILDDLKLKDHYTTVEQEEELRLLRPASAPYGYHASWLWYEGGEAVAGRDAQWQSDSTTLSADSPAVLTYEANGLSFERTISVDDNYMFTYTDRVTNSSGETRTLIPFGSINRHGQWKAFLEATDPGSSATGGMAHMGLIGVFDGNRTTRNYQNLAKNKGLKDADQRGERIASSGGWLGLTDKYWMASLIPEQGQSFRGRFRLIPRAEGQVFQVTTQGAVQTVQPGQTITVSNRIFAGAKEFDALSGYEEAGVPRFEDSIDWGVILYYITKPLFSLLSWLESNLGTFGLAILGLTLIVKIPLIPLYNQSYKSMAKMKKLAEPMKEIQERFAGDPQRRQQEVMKLYQREKANPIAGCLPILMTIPIFFALYKVLYVTIEMRHAEFLWLPDLSAPDTLVIGNLFGLIPWASAQEIHDMGLLSFVLGLGVLAIAYGVTMSAIQSLSPPPPDPTQKMIMRFLPLIFMFVFAGFASGLVLYWVWSNILSLIQQYFIMRRNGVETEFDKLLAKLMGKRGEQA